MLDVNGYFVQFDILRTEVVLEADGESLEGDQPVVRDLPLFVEDHFDQFENVLSRHGIKFRPHFNELNLQKSAQIIE